MSLKPLTRLVAVLFATVLSIPGMARAQSHAGARTVIALPQRFPDIEARALIVREPGRDVVVLKPSDASPETLAMSLALLDRMRVQDPEPEEGQLIPITGYVVTVPLGRAQLQRIRQTLSDLRGAPEVPVGSLGPGRWVPYPWR
jgi:hypothetical protein